MCRDSPGSYPRVVAYGLDDLFEVSKRQNQQETTVSLDMFHELWVGSPWNSNAGTDRSFAAHDKFILIVRPSSGCHTLPAKK